MEWAASTGSSAPHRAVATRFDKLAVWLRHKSRGQVVGGGRRDGGWRGYRLGSPERSAPEGSVGHLATLPATRWRSGGRGDGKTMETLPDGVTLAASLTDAPDATYSVAWSADGQWLAAAGHSGGVRLWSPETARTPRLARESDNGQNVSLTWHPSNWSWSLGPAVATTPSTCTSCTCARRATGALPLLLAHGWPGSVVEFLEVVEL